VGGKTGVPDLAAHHGSVEIYSLSKSYNMPGWRVGFCLGNRKMIAARHDVRVGSAAG